MIFRLFSLALLVPTVGGFLAEEPSRPRSGIDIVSFLFLPGLANQENAVFPFLESQPVSVRVPVPLPACPSDARLSTRTSLHNY